MGNSTPGPEYAAATRGFQGIPSLARSPKGRLWATWYGGQTAGEDRNNYVILVTSGDDGRTWSQEQVVIDPDGEGPVRAFDPELWLDPGGRMWAFWAQAIGHDASVGGVWAITSDNPDDEDAQDLYKSLWGIEVYFRHLKQTMDFKILKSRTPSTALNEHAWRLLSFWTLQHIMIAHQIAAGQNPRRFSAAAARREIRDVLQLMQQGKSGPALAKRSLRSQTDSYKRNGPKTTRDWARKKNDKPPKPPKTRPATEKEIQKAKQLGFTVLVI